jgi:class 3 adenylate cyclase
VSTDNPAAAIIEFLGGAPTMTAVRPTHPASAAFHTILFTDIEGSTALTERLGDAKARELLRDHERTVREALAAHGGSEIKTMGDGFMASFTSATRALECAIAIQRAFEGERGVGARRREDVSEPNLPSSTGSQDESRRVSEDSPLHSDSETRTTKPEPIRVRIGLNAGEPIAEDDPDGRSDLFGTAVIVAARIAAQAHGGEILVSDVVRQLVAGKGFLFNDRGEHALKGFEDPVRVFELRWKDTL